MDGMCYSLFCLLCTFAVYGHLTNAQNVTGSLSYISVIPTPSTTPIATPLATPTPTITLSTAAPTSTPSTASPTTTPTTAAPTTNPQLSLIIGLPIGVGLAVIGLATCLIWLTCSAYCENKDNPKTASSNVGVSNRSAGSQPAVHNYNSSSTVDNRAFEPSPARPQGSHSNPPGSNPNAVVAESNTADQVDDPTPKVEGNEATATDGSDSPVALGHKDHGSTFDITLRSPEPEESTPTLNEFDVSFHK